MAIDSIYFCGGIKDVRLSFPQEIKLKNNNKTRTFNLLTLSFAFQGLPTGEHCRQTSRIKIFIEFEKFILSNTYCKELIFKYKLQLLKNKCLLKTKQ